MGNHQADVSAHTHTLHTRHAVPGGGIGGQGVLLGLSGGGVQGGVEGDFTEGGVEQMARRGSTGRRGRGRGMAPALLGGLDTDTPDEDVEQEQEEEQEEEGNGWVNHGVPNRPGDDHEEDAQVDALLQGQEEFHGV